MYSFGFKRIIANYVFENFSYCETEIFDKEVEEISFDIKLSFVIFNSSESLSRYECTHAVCWKL